MILCNTGTSGCDGGYLYDTWSYIKMKGIPNNSCLEYPTIDNMSFDWNSYSSCPKSCTSDNSS